MNMCLAPLFNLTLVLTLAIQGFIFTEASAAQPRSNPVVKIDGATITEWDIALASQEIANQLTGISGTVQRRVVVEYLIKNQLLAAAAVRAGLGHFDSTGPQQRYASRATLREAYFRGFIAKSISDREVRAHFDSTIATQPTKRLINVSHILVATRDQAVTIFEKIAHGASFEAMAKRYSRDRVSGPRGGGLGISQRGQMAPAFEAAANKLAKGEISEPVRSPQGWHLIRADDHQKAARPSYTEMRAQIRQALIHDKTKQIVRELRRSARIEYLDRSLLAPSQRQANGNLTSPR